MTKNQLAIFLLMAIFSQYSALWMLYKLSSDRFENTVHHALALLLAWAVFINDSVVSRVTLWDKKPYTENLLDMLYMFPQERLDESLKRWTWVQWKAGLGFKLLTFQYQPVLTALSKSRAPAKPTKTSHFTMLSNLWDTRVKATECYVYF